MELESPKGRNKTGLKGTWHVMQKTNREISTWALSIEFLSANEQYSSGSSMIREDIRQKLNIIQEARIREKEKGERGGEEKRQNIYIVYNVIYVIIFHLDTYHKGPLYKT